jgi:hypothetical protein
VLYNPVKFLVRRWDVDFKRHPFVHSQVNTAKDEILSKLQQALASAGLDGFDINSISLNFKQPPKQCGPGEDLVWEPIETDDDNTVVYGWVCKPRT